jgi:hypothetical protein
MIGHEINPASILQKPMFKVVTRGFSQEFERWTEALDTANGLIPQCRGWFDELRIFEKGQVIWIYTRWHKYPQYIGPGTYNRLAQRFLLENTIDSENLLAAEDIPPGTPPDR